jgi:hypothetical protein
LNSATNSGRIQPGILVESGRRTRYIPCTRLCCAA